MSDLLKMLEARAAEIEAKAAADAAELRRLAAAASKALTADPERWVNVTNYLGEAMSKKVALNACRSGSIVNARKVGKHWVAKACDIDAWINRQTPSKRCDTEAEYLEKWMRKTA